MARVLALVESMARLDVLLYLRALEGRPATAKTIASVCRSSLLAAEQHLAKLCAHGLLAVNIGSDLHYSYRPIDWRARAAIDELDVLFVREREALTAWFAASMRPHVLVAEEDPDMREILRSFLESRGFRTTALSHGRESLAYASGEALALSVVDIRPSCLAAGLALVRALRERTGPVRTIVTTSFGDARLHSRIAELGVCGMLEKPFDLDDLGRSIEARGVAGHRNAPVV